MLIRRQLVLLHAGLAPDCDAVDMVITVGPTMKSLFDRLPQEKRWQHVESCRELDVVELSSHLLSGDELLVKGSKKMFWVEGFVARLLQQLLDVQKKARNQ